MLLSQCLLRIKGNYHAQNKNNWNMESISFSTNLKNTAHIKDFELHVVRFRSYFYICISNFSFKVHGSKGYPCCPLCVHFCNCSLARSKSSKCQQQHFQHSDRSGLTIHIPQQQQSQQECVSHSWINKPL